MHTSYATHEYLIRYAYIHHTICATDAYLIRYTYRHTVCNYRPLCGAHLIRYACIPHTLRMQTSYATHAYLIHYAYRPHTLRMHTSYEKCHRITTQTTYYSTSDFVLFKKEKLIWSRLVCGPMYRVSLALAKAADLRSTFNLDGVPITSKSNTHPSHSQTSRLLTSTLSLGVP